MVSAHLNKSQIRSISSYRQFFIVVSAPLARVHFLLRESVFSLSTSSTLYTDASLGRNLDKTNFKFVKATFSYFLTKPYYRGGGWYLKLLLYLENSY